MSEYPIGNFRTYSDQLKWSYAGGWVDERMGVWMVRVRRLQYVSAPYHSPLPESSYAYLRYPLRSRSQDFGKRRGGFK